MDHDDELYPEALEAGVHGWRARTGADVLNGKENTYRPGQVGLALEVYAREEPGHHA